MDTPFRRQTKGETRITGGYLTSRWTWSCLAVELEEAGPEITADVDHDLLVAGEDLGVGLSSAVLGQKDQVDIKIGDLAPSP